MHEDSYNYYDTDVDNILLFKKSGNEYIIMYNDVNKMKVAPLQLKIMSLFCEIHTYENSDRAAIFRMMIKNFLKNAEKYGIKLLN